MSKETFKDYMDDIIKIWAHCMDDPTPRLREVWNHQQKKLEAVTAERDYYKENYHRLYDRIYHRLYDRIDEANSENQDLRTKLEASEDNVKAFKEKTGQVTIEKEEWKSKAFKVNWDIGGIENKLKIAVEALEHIKKHQEVKASHTDSRMFKLSAIWLMTDKALEKIKGMEG